MDELSSGLLSFGRAADSLSTDRVASPAANGSSPDTTRVEACPEASAEFRLSEGASSGEGGGEGGEARVHGGEGAVESAQVSHPRAPKVRDLGQHVREVGGSQSD